MTSTNSEGKLNTEFHVIQKSIEQKLIQYKLEL